VEKLAVSCKKLPKFIGQNDVLRILDGINTNCWTGVRHYAVVMVLYRAGLRVSELCNLALSDCNFESGMLYVQAGKGKKDRYVPMDDDISSSVQKWIEIRPDSQWLFCTAKGDQLDPRYVRDMCYRLSHNAGVYIQDGKEQKKVSPHKFRHSCFTSLLQEGNLNIREIQTIAGHSRLETTMIYTHIVMDDIKAKVKNRKRLGR
jgi:site-specific recombinase XerD